MDMDNYKPFITELVTYRTVSVDIKVRAPTAGAYEDWERELKQKIARAVNNAAMARRHGVSVTSPGLPWGAARDSDFSVYLSVIVRNADLL